MDEESIDDNASEGIVAVEILLSEALDEWIEEKWSDAFLHVAHLVLLSGALLRAGLKP
jgi:hypothetical protein